MPNASGRPLTRVAQVSCRAAAPSVVPLVTDTVFLSVVSDLGLRAGGCFFLAGLLACPCHMLFDCKAPCGTSPRPLAPWLVIVSGSERLAATRCSTARRSGSEKTLRLLPLRLGRGLRAKTHDQPISQSALFPKMLEQLRWGI